MNLPESLIYLASASLKLLPLWISLSLLSAVSARLAWHLGDESPAHTERMTLDPLQHLEWMGSFAVPLVLAMLFSGGLGGGSYSTLGWSRPQGFRPVLFERQSSPRRSMMVWAGALILFQLSLALVGVGFMTMALYMGQSEEGFLFILAKGLTHTNCELAILSLVPTGAFVGRSAMNIWLPSSIALRLERFNLRHGDFGALGSVLVIHSLWVFIS